jgi:HD-like signal output (HDOD) protein
MGAPSSTLLPAFTDAIKRRDFVVPAYPAAALRLRRLMSSDNYGVRQISEAVSSDPALAATVLRLANSPLYRPDGPPITALGRAIHRIGVRSLSTIATASGVGAQLRELALEATDIRARAGSALKSTAISSDGLRLKSERPFQEATLVHLKVHRPGAPLTVWMSVVLSAPEASGFRVEVQLFAPSRELRSDWLSLFESGLAAQSTAS